MNQLELPFIFKDKVIIVQPIILSYSTVKRLYERVVYTDNGYISLDKEERKSDFYGLFKNIDILIDEYENIIFDKIKFKTDQDRELYLNEINSVITRIEKKEPLEKHFKLVSLD